MEERKYVVTEDGENGLYSFEKDGVTYIVEDFTFASKRHGIDRTLRIATTKETCTRCNKPNCNAITIIDDFRDDNDEVITHTLCKKCYSEFGAERDLKISPRG